MPHPPPAVLVLSVLSLFCPMISDSALGSECAELLVDRTPHYLPFTRIVFASADSGDPTTQDLGNPALQQEAPPCAPFLPCLLLDPRGTFPQSNSLPISLEAVATAPGLSMDGQLQLNGLSLLTSYHLSENSLQHILVMVQSPSHVQLFATPWTAACQAFLSLTISQSLPKFMSTESVMPSDHLIL